MAAEPGTDAFTAEEIADALERVRLRLEAERRRSFAGFGIPSDCPWPAARLYHEHSAIGPGWAPTMTVEEAEALTERLDYKRYPDAVQVSLPTTRPLSAGLEDAIRRRISERAFSPEPVALDAAATLLRLGSGVIEWTAVPRRAAPSPGGLYPVETYPVALRVEGLDAGVYHYAPLDDVLELVSPLDGREAMQPFLPPDLYEASPALAIVLAVVFPRVQAKYLERGYRFALLEAGHIAQNVLLAATALGLHSVPLGGFWDDPFNRLMGFDGVNEAVVYAVLVGRPDTGPSDRE